MTRLLFLLGLIALTVFLIKKIYSEKLPSKAQESKVEPSLMRKCALCSMHVPDAQSISDHEKFFCSTAHRDEFLKL